MSSSRTNERLAFSSRGDNFASVKIKRHQVIIAALILLGLTFLTIGVLYQQDPVKYYAHSLRTWQEADSVAGYPIATGSEKEFRTAVFEPNLSSMTPLERFRLPIARGFDRSAGEDAAAAGTGLVLYTGDPAGYPGKAVLLGHRLPDQAIVQTLYTGMSKINVRVGQQLPRGTKLGTGGSLSEVRTGTAIDLARETVSGVVLNDHEAPLAPNRLDLKEFLRKHPRSGPEGDLLTTVQEEALKEALREQNIQTK
jgi:hypothetical protein